MTALYEIECAPETNGALAWVGVRYLTIDDGESVELGGLIDSLSTHENFADASLRFRLSAYVAEFAEILRDSYWARESRLDRLAELTQKTRPRSRRRVW